MLFNKRPRAIERLLIVEDEPLVAFDNEYQLRDMGYEVVATVDNYAAAEAVIDREPLDLILSDVTLQGAGSGVDVARRAKARGVPVLLVTADPPPEARDIALGVLAKPYNERTLKAALECIDAFLGGERPAKLPPGLILFETPQSAD